MEDVSENFVKTKSMTRATTASPTILIVDDSSLDGKIIERQVELIWPNARILSAESLLDAHELCREENIDICLLDLNLPDGHGAASVLEFRRFFGKKPIIAISGTAQSDVASNARKFGADDFIQKASITSLAFENILRQHMTQQKSH
jgi:CheY-like chemotaxis protein